MVRLMQHMAAFLNTDLWDLLLLLLAILKLTPVLSLFLLKMIFSDFFELPLTYSPTTCDPFF